MYLQIRLVFNKRIKSKINNYYTSYFLNSKKLKYFLEFILRVTPNERQVKSYRIIPICSK